MAVVAALVWSWPTAPIVIIYLSTRIIHLLYWLSFACDVVIVTATTGCSVHHGILTEGGEEGQARGRDTTDDTCRRNHAYSTYM